MWKIWIWPSKTSEATRLRLYTCYKLPILLYNCGTWALTYAELCGLESFHRRQLRKVIGVSYPETISNDDLYTRTGAEPLRYHLLKRRWTLFGDILRLSMKTPDIPAYRHMEAYFGPSDQPKFRGRRRTTLPEVLDADLRTLPDDYRLRRPADLYLLRCHAQDRKEWKRLIQSLLAYIPLDERDPTYANTTLAKRLSKLTLE
ncbi:uncharacterized protein PHALS_11636 [Plasmopara halstedii]|uniref:Uncharacterized protein n=1 Tax=Plasmopara halstedii TaxID=4781 RepID=A0A0P1AJA0_PLAHL|nr:uncharacterized protein PHALS_11636 [Plasmopara halstedii]CEG41279.1 hypothetical protein PHALS_11636 [Plasmopara halstedii]|eukprot:XP_024577648.1 hypothetical protein PHALS_11636 [Plasmopara halstedii]